MIHFTTWESMVCTFNLSITEPQAGEALWACKHLPTMESAGPTIENRTREKGKEKRNRSVQYASGRWPS